MKKIIARVTIRLGNNPTIGLLVEGNSVEDIKNRIAETEYKDYEVEHTIFFAVEEIFLQEKNK